MSKLSKIAIVIQCITNNPSSLLFAKERKETLPNPRAKSYLRGGSSELESKNIKRDPRATDLLHFAQHRTLLIPRKARAKGKEALAWQH